MEGLLFKIDTQCSRTSPIEQLMDTIIAEALDLSPQGVPEIVEKAKEAAIRAAKELVKTPVGQP